MIKNIFEDVNGLIGIRETPHAAHYAQHIVVGRIHTHLCRVVSAHGLSRKVELERGVVNTGEVARARWLVLLRLECEGVDVDTRIRVAGVVLVGLDGVEVGTLALRETVLSVELKLGGHDGVLTPAMHVEGSLRKHERASITHTGVLNGTRRNFLERICNTSFSDITSGIYKDT